MRRRSVQLGTIFAASLALGALVVAGCGSTTASEFEGRNGEGNGGGGSSGGFGNGKDDDGGTVEPPCVGLECNQVACAGGGTTSLSGKVYDPTGTVPLYNAIVYVPNAPLEPFKDGVTCDQCGTAPSGYPVTTAVTDATGSFTLKNVPVGVDVPLVVQVGRWRRQVTVPAVKECADTPLSAEDTRLPRSKAEGSIPKIAITTGGADSLECFLRKLGVEDEEFTAPTGDGRIHLFQGVSGSRMQDVPSANNLWDDPGALKNYDMVILSCEGDEYNAGKSEAARENLKNYLDTGGRVFASHYHYTWFKKGAAPLPTTANWISPEGSFINSANMSVNTSFAKGQAFSEWLVEAGASVTPGLVPGTQLRANVTTVPGSGATKDDVSRAWLTANNQTKFFSFNAPVGAELDKQCGRGVYTDIHVSTGAGADSSGGTFPNNCKSPKPALSPQEKALLFLLMDLASCIQDDGKPPVAPPAGPK